MSHDATDSGEKKWPFCFQNLPYFLHLPFFKFFFKLKLKNLHTIYPMNKFCHELKQHFNPTAFLSAFTFFQYSFLIATVALEKSLWTKCLLATEFWSDSSDFTSLFCSNSVGTFNLNLVCTQLFTQYIFQQFFCVTPRFFLVFSYSVCTKNISSKPVLKVLNFFFQLLVFHLYILDLCHAFNFLLLYSIVIH